MTVRLFGVALLVVVSVYELSSAQDNPKTNGKAVSANGIAFFEKQVASILKRRCYECHSHESGKAKGGLVLDSRRGWQKGGSEGAAIVPGKPGESLLMEAVRYESYEMPPDKETSGE